MSVCEVKEPTLSYVICLKPLSPEVGLASPESDGGAISDAHCDGGYRAQALRQTIPIELEYMIRAEFFIRMLSHR